MNINYKSLDSYGTTCNCTTLVAARHRPHPPYQIMIKHRPHPNTPMNLSTPPSSITSTPCTSSPLLNKAQGQPRTSQSPPVIPTTPTGPNGNQTHKQPLLSTSPIGRPAKKARTVPVLPSSASNATPPEDSTHHPHILRKKRVFPLASDNAECFGRGDDAVAYIYEYGACEEGQGQGSSFVALSPGYSFTPRSTQNFLPVIPDAASSAGSRGPPGSGMTPRAGTNSFPGGFGIYGRPNTEGTYEAPRREGNGVLPERGGGGVYGPPSEGQTYAPKPGAYSSSTAKSYIAHMPDPVIPSAEMFCMTPRAGNNALPGAGSGIYGRPSEEQTLARILPAHQRSQHPQHAVRRRPTLNRGITNHHKRNMVQRRVAQGLVWRIIRVQEGNINHCHLTITIIDLHLLCVDYNLF
jgi:hypothetical protein